MKLKVIIYLTNKLIMFIKSILLGRVDINCGEIDKGRH